MPRLYRQINIFILDTLFPITCLLCHKESVWLCPSCVQKITLLSFQVCPYCEKEITTAGRICEKCKKKQFEKNSAPALDALLSATEYREISKLVHLFKYNFVLELGVPLGKLITRSLWQNNLPLPNLIIPVPIHRRKLKWRGFNQAELLALTISQNLTPGIEIPVNANLLYRKKHTKAQMKIKAYKERLANLSDAFALSLGAKEIISGKRILLIDDIATTGATLLECAKVLKSAGATEVTGAIIARQKI